MDINIENETLNLITKYQEICYIQKKGDLDICVKQIFYNLHPDCCKIGNLMVFLISIMEIDIDKNIIYQLIYNLMVLKNIMYFYFALPPFSVNIKFCYSSFNNGVNYLSLFTMI